MSLADQRSRLLIVVPPVYYQAPRTDPGRGLNRIYRNKIRRTRIVFKTLLGS